MKRKNEAAPKIDSLNKPLPKKSVSKIVLSRIKEAMLNRELKPGDYLPSETELTRSLGVGKTSVREAIKMLEAMGIVKVVQGHGTYIAEQPDGESINPLTFQLLLEPAGHPDLIELRRVFEPAFCVLAMEKATDEDVSRLGEAITQFEEKISKGIQSAEDDIEFHLRILECTKNPYMIRIGRTIYQLFTSSVRISMTNIPETALDDHKKIYAAFKNRDRKKLLDAVSESFAGWESSLDKNGG